MDKSSFYDRMRSGLAELGCDDGLCSEWVEAAKEYLSPVSDADFNRRGYVQADVIRLIDRIVESPDTAFNEFFGPVSADADGEKVPEPADVELDDIFAEDPVPVPSDTVVFDTSDVKRLEVEDADVKRIESVPDAEPAEHTRMREREKVRGTPMFYALLAVTSPLWAPLYAAVWVCVGAIYVAAAALIAAAAVSMVVVVALGTALSLVGIIYGVITAFKTMPIGLFEIGLGIALAGATLFCAIIFYNLAIRWLPKLFKYINRFAEFVAGKLKKLYVKAKKGSAKL